MNDNFWTTINEWQSWKTYRLTEQTGKYVEQDVWIYEQKKKLYYIWCRIYRKKCIF